MKKILLSLSCIAIFTGASTTLISCKMRSSEIPISFSKGNLKVENFSLGNSKNIATIAINKLFQLFVYTGKGKESLKKYMGVEAIENNSFYKIGDRFPEAKEFIEFISKPNKYSFTININNDNYQPLNIKNFKPINVDIIKINNSKNKFEIKYENAKVSEKTLDEMSKENDNIARELVEKYKEQYFLSQLEGGISINEISFGNQNSSPVKEISSEEYYKSVVGKIKKDIEDIKDIWVSNLNKEIETFDEKIKKASEDQKNLLYQECANKLNKDFQNSNLYKIEPIKKEMDYIVRLSSYTDEKGNKHQAIIDDLYCKKIESLIMELKVFDKNNLEKTIKVKIPQIYIIFKPIFLGDKNDGGDKERNLIFLQCQNYQFTEFISSENIFKDLKIEII